jgi:hypothetical protein
VKKGGGEEGERARGQEGKRARGEEGKRGGGEEEGGRGRISGQLKLTPKFRSKKF